MTDVFSHMTSADHEQVAYFRVPDARLEAIVAIHDTTLGPALGGVRMWPYASEEDALRDVLSLSHDMTLKAAAAGLRLGGGKAVIISSNEGVRREEFFAAFGRCINALAGRYIAAEDVGTTVADIDAMRRTSPHVVGTDPAKGGRGDPSPMTALGVFHGMIAARAHRDGASDLAGAHVAVQGVGKVGAALVELLLAAGARVTIADIDANACKRFAQQPRVAFVDADAIHDCACDIFAPCALGGSITHMVAARLNCRIIAGGANGQLAHHDLADCLDERGILYVPDFVINAGGLISVAAEREVFDSAAVRREVEAVGIRVGELLAEAHTSGRTPLACAISRVDKLLKKARAVRPRAPHALR